MKLRWMLALAAGSLVLGLTVAWAQPAEPIALSQEVLVPPPPPAPATPTPPQAPKVTAGEVRPLDAPPPPPALPAPPKAPQGVVGGVVAPSERVVQGVEGGVQSPKVVKAPEAPPPPPVPARRPSQLVNVKVELTITNQVGSAAPDVKTIMMLVAENERGSIRSNTELWEKIEELVAGQTSIKTNVRPVQLAVDAWPEVEGSKIRLRLSLEYDLIGEKGPGNAGKTSIRESLSVVLNDGVPLTTALSADPMTDRKVTLDVKATVVK